MWKRNQRIQNFFRSPIFYIAVVFIVSRIILEIIGVHSDTVYHGVNNNLSEWQTTKNVPVSLGTWSVWDSGWYLDIAKRGYSLVVPPEAPRGIAPGSLNIGFFPLYSILIRLVFTVTQNYYWAGLLVSNSCLVASAYLLFKIVEKINTLETARYAVLYLFLFPTAFILSAIFSESLFLFLLLLSYYYGLHKNWIASSVVGFFLALTRPTGFLMVLPLFLLYMKERKFSLKNISPRIVFFGLFPLGMFSFMLYTYALTGNLLAYFHAKELWWGDRITNPITTIQMLSQGSPSSQIVFTLILIEVSVLTLGYLYKKIDLFMALVAVMVLLPPFLEGPYTTGSIPRMSCVIFPFAIIFAKVSTTKMRTITICAFLVAFQVLLMSYWSNGMIII